MVRRFTLLLALFALSAAPGDLRAAPVAQPVPQIERHGRVVAEDGTPVAGAIVWHSRHPNPYGVPTDEQAARTDSAGHFSLTYPQYTPLPETKYLHVFAAGHPINSTSFDPSRSDELFMQLAPPVFIEGTVRDEATGELLGGVGVIARPISMSNHGSWPTGPFQDESPEIVRSSPGGAFTVPAGPGIWSVGLMHDGYLPETVDGIEVDQQPVRIDPSLTRGLDVRGRVTDASGSPLAEVQVSLGHLRTTTGSDGTFELRGLEQGSQYLSLNNGRMRLSRTIELTGDTPDLHVAFPPEGTVEGIVRDAASGEPIEDALVILDALGGEVTLVTNHLKTDAAGRFSANVPSGRIRLAASAPDSVPHWAEERTIDGGEIVTYDIELTAGTRLSGKVTDEYGQPLEAHVRVEKDPWMNTTSHFYELMASTDQHGRYVIDNVASGTREVTLWSRCCLPKTVEIEFAAPDAILNAVLEHGLSISGIVTDVSEAPLRDVELRAMRGEGDATEKKFARTDAAGRFELAGLSPDRWTLTIEDQHYVSSPIELTRSTDDVVIVATPGAVIHGTILGIDGGGRVTALRNERGERSAVAHSRIDKDRRYRITGLEAGSIELVLMLDPAETVPLGTVDVLPAQEYRHDFDLDKVARARGRVVLNGETLHDYTIHWRSSDGRRGFARATNENSIDVAGLEDGDYWAIVSGGPVDHLWVPFTVSSGTFEIVLDGGPLRIVVTDHEDEPIEGAEIAFRNRGGPHLSLAARTDAKGVASIPFVPYGPLPMRVKAAGVVATPTAPHKPGMSELRIRINRIATAE